ncbi:hypothetical protein ACWEPN_36435 [Nonomuraea wenchangensis]
MAVALFLTDLETLSWIAGAGSFIVAVLSLVVALHPSDNSDRHARIPDPASEDAPGRSNLDASPAAEDEGSVIVELKTARIRIAKRIAAPFKGAGMAAIVMIVMIGITALFEGAQVATYSAEELLNIYAAMAGVMAVAVFFLGGGDGKDLLIVDRIGVTIVDKRWIRARDGSFAIPWALVRSIRIEPSSASHALMVKFEDAREGTVEHAQIETLVRCIKRDAEAHYYSSTSYNVAWLYLASGGAERTALLRRVHKALARFGGDSYVH